jgi:hypothetical protein
MTVTYQVCETCVILQITRQVFACAVGDIICSNWVKEAVVILGKTLDSQCSIPTTVASVVNC